VRRTAGIGTGIHAPDACAVARAADASALTVRSRGAT